MKCEYDESTKRDEKRIYQNHSLESIKSIVAMENGMMLITNFLTSR